MELLYPSGNRNLEPDTFSWRRKVNTISLLRKRKTCQPKGFPTGELASEATETAVISLQGGCMVFFVCTRHLSHFIENGVNVCYWRCFIL
ncbi:MAG TPA: hypothetical protein OIM03_01310 [Veillonellaceae bacterium]|nr:hypothetical protein [Veillonellaceae bacterium]